MGAYPGTPSIFTGYCRIAVLLKSETPLIRAFWCDVADWVWCAIIMIEVSINLPGVCSRFEQFGNSTILVGIRGMALGMVLGLVRRRDNDTGGSH